MWPQARITQDWRYDNNRPELYPWQFIDDPTIRAWALQVRQKTFRADNKGSDLCWSAAVSGMRHALRAMAAVVEAAPR